MHRVVEGVVLRETDTREADKILTVLTRSIRSAGKGAFVRIASLAFEEELRALAAAHSAYRISISCHCWLHLLV